MSAVSMGTGAVILGGGLGIQRKPSLASVWGVGILVASVIGLVSMSSFIIGPILGIVGGIIALVEK